MTGGQPSTLIQIGEESEGASRKKKKGKIGRNWERKYLEEAKTDLLTDKKEYLLTTKSLVDNEKVAPPPNH